MAPDQLPTEVQNLIRQTMDQLGALVTPSALFDDETQDAVFEAIDAVNGDMRTLSKEIHGVCFEIELE